MIPIFLKGIIACVIAFWFGGVMIWRGATGQVWRSHFTGDAVIPGWMYIAAGAGAIAAALGYIVVTYFLAKT
jgi:ABC-type thiamin/hydroxymethylpyrimidine transport system permease subunit